MPTIPVEIRYADESDRAGYAEIDRLATADLRAVYQPTEKAEKSRSAMSRQLHRLVALGSSRIVGTVQYHMNSDRLAFLGLGVHPHFRRQGIARQLIEELEAIAVRNQVELLTLYTVRQTGNVDVFQSLGFTVVSEERTDFFESPTGEPLTEVLMQKLVETLA